MGRTEVSDIQNAKTFTNVDKLSLDAGEKARVLLIEGTSWIVEFTHELRNKARATKAEKEAGAQDLPQDFYGNFLCHGRQEILQTGDPDIDSCPFCAQVASSSGKILPAKRGFATNVIRYATPKFEFNLIQPAQVKLLAWVHKDERKFRNIKDLGAEWGDLRAHDLLITCENVFQNYAISVAATAAYQQDPALQQLVEATFANNKYDDDGLTEALGRRVDAEQAERHIRTVMAAATNPAVANNGYAAVPGGYAAAPQAAVPPALAAQAAAVPLTGTAPVALPAIPQAAPALPPAPVAAPGYAAALPQAAPPPVALPPAPVAAPAALPPAPVAPPLDLSGVVPQAAPVAAPQPVQAAPAVPQVPALPALAGLDQQG